MIDTDYIILDFETTGLSPRMDKVIEVGAVRVSNNKIIDTFECLINPGRRISGVITSITGITNKMLVDAPSSKEVIPKLHKFVQDLPIVAHNASFDSNFLKAEFDRCYLKTSNSFLCTLLLSRRIYQNLSSHKLENLCRHLGVVNEVAHRALSDVYATKEVFSNICSEIMVQSSMKKLSVNYLQQVSKTPKKNIPLLFQERGHVKYK